MKVLFAVSNEKMSESIVKQYQKDYKQIISYKNVYYFNAILKELQRDKGYDRIVISEDLEQYVNTDYEQMDNFLFSRLDSISDEASNMNGEDIPIILICTERRNKSEQILTKLFGIGVYNAIIGNDRSVNEVCRLINRPRSKKEAKIYYKIDSDEVSYARDDENDVSELEIQNILAHYKRLGNDEDRYVESFDSIASQYNDVQLRVISKFLPLSVRAVLEERSPKYQQINSYNNKISDKVRLNPKKSQPGTSEILLKNAKTKDLNEPVVVPSSIDASKKRKIVSKPSQTEKIYTQEKSNEETTMVSDVNLDDLKSIDEVSEIESLDNQDINVMQEEPVKKRRGRPRKIVEEPIEQMPKRKRGRPRKNVEGSEEGEMLLPGLDGQDEEEAVLPGFEEQEENILPGFNTQEEEDSVLPGFDNEEEEEESTLPGLENQEDDEENTLPGFDNEEDDEDDEDETLPGFEENEDEVEDNYTNVLQSLKEENERQEYSGDIPRMKQTVSYPELDMNRLLAPDQKIVSFVGTSKNGTSFLVNNVAELLSTNGVDTAILDLTHNRNAYFIYTKNEEELRTQSNYTMKNLKIGKVSGIQEHKNLTIYTSSFENDEDLLDVEPIVETLVKSHKVVLMDCDFTTPMRYFKYAQEIYLVQSMDILTIQPLTAFLRQLSDKQMFDESKVRVVLNKFMRTREINEELLIGGISIYNDAGMTVRKELFNRKTARFITIPFELKTYLRYLDGLVVCDVSLKGYSKEFMQSLKQLANMVYGGNKSSKYVPPSVKKNMTFSKSMDDTLNQMKQNY